MKNTLVILMLVACLAYTSLHAQGLTANNTHSHNDYLQNIPLLQAYYAGAGSIEADVFLVDGKLCVAHERKSISPERTLTRLYLEPLADLFRKNGNRPYADASQKLQLVIDIKEDHQHVIPALLKELALFKSVFNDPNNKNTVKIVLSGDMPAPAQFGNYPEVISYDGRPNIVYTDGQLKRIAMISDALDEHTKWNGKGTITSPDSVALTKLVNAAHALHKPFRFWATPDSPNAWLQLEKLGVDWMNTDHPQQLHDFYSNRAKILYVNPAPYAVYQPTYKSDGSIKKVKNVILLIGDGMGLAQIQAGLTANHGQLNMLQCKYIGLSQTKAVNSDNTDSAAGGTAMACGEKTNNRYVGTDTKGKPLTNIPDTLSHYGIKSGIISAGDITDATPAAFYAHQIERNLSLAIARDFLQSHVDVLIGSNQKSFRDSINSDLPALLKQKQYDIANNLTALNTGAGKQMILLSDADTRPVKDGRGDMLHRALQGTIKKLSNNKNGFFIMAEGAQIDYGGHANDLPYVVTELHDFDKTIAEALKFADQDGETLVIITADHETGGLTLLEASTAAGMVLGNFSTNDHTSINVPVFAYGPGAQEFSGTYQNTEIYKKIVKLITQGR